jgi:transketolase
MNADAGMKERILEARRRLLRMHFEAKVGHLGGNLSCLDALMVLHHRILGPEDLFILSKGHSAGALYVTLWSLGRLKDEDLGTFHQDGTRLSGHPVAGWHPGIRFGTGSLGHGQGLAAGSALGRRLRSAPGRVYCLMSDGEWQEGSAWEALIFSVHQRLDNLTLLVDGNGLQGFGSTEEIASVRDLAPRFAAFGAEAVVVDGHDPAALEAALAAPPSGRPRVLVLRTVKGRGVSFMEDRMEWHYKALDQALFDRAMEELKA